MKGLFCSLSIAFSAAPAAPVTPPKAIVAPAPVKASASVELVERVQKFYETTTDFTAEFSQDYTYKTFRRTQHSTGQVAFKKPAMMRWDYEAPAGKSFVLAGDVAYALDSEALTLTKTPFDANQLSAAVTFLWGKGKLLTEFDVAPGTCAGCPGVRLILTPKKTEARFQRVYLDVEEKTGKVLRSTVIDPDGSENAITFNKLVANVGVADARFKLTPPPGTQVVDLTRPQSPKP